MKARLFWIIAGLLVIGAIVTFVLVRPQLQQLRGGANPAAAQGETAEVRAMQAMTTVEASGAVEPQQQASLNWQTSGTIAAVEVAVGDTVRAGDVLMRLDPASAATNVIQAQSDLISAQTALEELIEPPTALDIADAEQAIVDAEEQLEAAQKELRGVANPDVAYYADQVADKEQALLTAQQNAEKTNLGDVTNALENARDNLEDKTNQLSDARTAQEQCPGCTTLFINATGRRMELSQAQEEYDAALDAFRIAELNHQQALASNADAVAAAQEELDDARANLAGAQAGPNAQDLAQKQVAVAQAEAALADAHEKLDTVMSGAKADDIAAAEVRIQAAQAVLDSVILRAPFAGEVLAVNYQPGDPVSQETTPVVLANRSRLHVDVAVDETEVGQISLGDSVSLTVDALPGLDLAGTVGAVETFGQTVQGLVRYNVRVDLASTDPRLYLNMTASAIIVTEVLENALAVPLEAVQYDGEGEFVNRIGLAGIVERVNVTSGVIDGDWVTVSGDLEPGDTVQLAPPELPSFGGPFGGG
jgi:HlyD family secretion protein